MSRPADTEREAAGVLRTLLENLVSLAESAGDGEMLRATLADAVGVATELTGAERGSLLLLDEEGRVTDSLLAREEPSEEDREELVGAVLETGVAGWVRRQRETALVFDTADDPRWVTLADEPYEVRSALVVPVRRGDRLVGLLTLMHPRPGHFDERAAVLMELTAEQIGLVLDNASLVDHLARARARAEELLAALEAELAAGRRMQQSFLPSELPVVPGWELAACFRPAREVGGDLYDAFALDDGRLAFVVGDVCGKGVPAALFMALVRSLVRVFAGLAPGRSGGPQEEGFRNVLDGAGQTALDVVSHVDRYLLAHHRALGVFATLFLGVVEPETGGMVYVNAGHEPPLVRSVAGTVVGLDPTGPAVGAVDRARFGVGRAALGPGEVLLLYTDGVTDTTTEAGEAFGPEGLRSLLSAPAGDAGELLGRIESALGNHAGGAEAVDDLTLLVLRRRELPTPRRPTY
jgi:sigma-B regulation protein RsbU (phosphoserine phosphatase)